jgi:hypothetical protein
VRGSWRLLLVGAGVAVAVVLFFVLRNGGSDNEGSSSGTTTSETRTETRPKPVPPKPIVVRIAVRNGSAPIKRVTIPRGRQVVIVVTSDVADHIHLHGYNVLRPVAPEKPARLVFKATIPGRFDVELEDRGVQIADLSVLP